jgi:hypothetical protein
MAHFMAMNIMIPCVHGSGSGFLFIHYGMANFVAMNIMITYTLYIYDLSIFLLKCVYLRLISQNHSNKKRLTVTEYYIGTNMEILCFPYLLLKKQTNDNLLIHHTNNKLMDGHNDKCNYSSGVISNIASFCQ